MTAAKGVNEKYVIEMLEGIKADITIIRRLVEGNTLSEDSKELEGETSSKKEGTFKHSSSSGSEKAVKGVDSSGTEGIGQDSPSPLTAEKKQTKEPDMPLEAKPPPTRKAADIEKLLYPQDAETSLDLQPPKPKHQPQVGGVPEFDMSKIDWQDKISRRNGKHYEETLRNDGNPEQVKLRKFILTVTSPTKHYAKCEGYSLRIIDNGNIQRFKNDR